jgi:hypothetical protein
MDSLLAWICTYALVSSVFVALLLHQMVRSTPVTLILVWIKVSM